MIPEKFEHSAEYEADHLSFGYESYIAIMRDHTEMAEILKNHLLRERERVINQMRSLNYTEEEIKKTLKIAADQNAKYLEPYGIEPSSLY